MKFEQVYAAAESDCGYINDNRCIKVYISALVGTAAPSGLSECIRKEMSLRGLDAIIISAGSMGYYDLEPLVVIEKPDRYGGMMYGNVTPQTIAGFIDDYLVDDSPGPDSALCSTGSDRFSGIPHISEMPLFTGQDRLALRNCGYISPENINHYIVWGKGYTGLSSVLQMARTEVISKLRASGLRGRGGAGYCTADKWQDCYDAEGNEKYVICNAVDSDPQSMTARLLLGSDPHSVLEGLLIGGYAVGAAHCIICVDVEDKHSIRILGEAIEQMRQYNLLGPDILDSDFSADIELREITTSLVTGEETALLRTLEGKQARPYLLTNYAAPRGYNGSPAVVNNIETFSNVSGIFQNRPEWLSSIGMESSKGTKTVTISDGSARKLTVEIPFGTTLRTLVGDISGSVMSLQEIQAAQFGGCMGAFFSVDGLDIPITYESMENAGSVIGSGAAVIFCSGICPVEMAKEAVSYLQTESCGQCVFCREGTFQMSDILADIAEFRGSREDLEMLEELGELMKKGCICNLGSNAPNPVQSSLRLFRKDYEAHINEKWCLAIG